MTTTISPPRPAARNRTWTEEAAERALRALGAGGVYALAIGLASWSFAPLLAFAVRQGLTRLWATVIEAPALLLLLALIAAALIRLFRVRDRAGDRLLVGAVGITLLVAAELVGGRFVRGWGLYETLVNFMAEPSRLFLTLLIGAVLVPLLEPIGRPKPAGIEERD